MKIIVRFKGGYFAGTENLLKRIWADIVCRHMYREYVYAVQKNEGTAALTSNFTIPKHCMYKQKERKGNV